ncbi:VIT1/CCC1 transporter family protein [Cellulosimicrobium cellulans]|uniref:VIT1/CCC1 transporter family protein n=1 Tax=Cellulosimicrobium cellulans TaxID=1710 RepID=UPI001112E7DA|nr:VIT1/CCC1 family protein [Cellulosimicrobium cellulans]
MPTPDRPGPGVPADGTPETARTPEARDDVAHRRSARDVRRWRRYLADERAEAAAYRDLASRRSGEEREILLALAEAEGRHEQHWLDLLGDDVGRPLPGDWRTRTLGWLARRFGGVFVLALAQRAESRSSYATDADATASMAADERIHEEVVRGLATRGRNRMSGTFRAAVFGANDGLVSNLALILGIGASGASPTTVLLSGLAGLLAGALSMGAGEFVSVRSQRELLDASTPSPQASAALPDLDVDANELALVYRARGMTAVDAEAHARDVLATYTAQTVIAPAPAGDEHETHGTAIGAAVSSFLFFASGALIPVLPYLFGMTGLGAVAVASGLVTVALLATGATVGLLSGTSPVTRALRQVAIGLGAAAATYVLGLVFGATVG